MMQRIRAVLDKMNVLAQRKSDRTVIDIDLMLDYTRMVYADLLDLRETLAGKAAPATREPTLDELTAAMAQQETPVYAAATRQPQVVTPPAAVPAPAPAPVAHPAAATQKDIRSLIDLNEKYLLLSGLFRNDIRAYEETMQTINTLQTEEEALAWVGAKQWPAHDDAARSLRELLKQFYA